MSNHSEQWHADRSTGIGGSDISAIVGLDKYSSPMRVYLDKIGVPQEQPTSEAMEWGTRTESIVADKFAEMHPEYIVKKELEPNGEETLFRHPDFSFAVAHPDRLLYETGDETAPPAVWECKTAGREARKYTWTVQGVEYPPLSVIAQVQWYIAIVGASYAWISVLFEGRYYREWRLERDSAFIAHLLEEGEKFWALVETRTPPPIDASSATADVLAILYRETIDEVIELPPEFEALAAQRLKLKATLKADEDALQGVDNQLKAALGEHEVGYAGKFPVTWKSRAGRKTADVKALEADGLLDYLHEGKPYRVFSVGEEAE